MYSGGSSKEMLDYDFHLVVIREEKNKGKRKKKKGESSSATFIPYGRRRGNKRETRFS